MEIKMSIELKVKSKHLSEEARIIRFEEYKLLKQWRYDIKKYASEGHNEPLRPYSSKAYLSYESLKNHRTFDVRNENRATYLARAYIAGIPYSCVEQRRKPEKEYVFQHKIINRVASMVAKYGKTKIQKEAWQGPFMNRKLVKTPEYEQLLENIRAWSEL
jgi:hypothetical protein